MEEAKKQVEQYVKTRSQIMNAELTIKIYNLSKTMDKQLIQLSSKIK